MYINEPNILNVGYDIFLKVSLYPYAMLEVPLRVCYARYATFSTRCDKTIG
jgi:hypothetical protein